MSMKKSCIRFLSTIKGMPKEISEKQVSLLNVNEYNLYMVLQVQ